MASEAALRRVDPKSLSDQELSRICTSVPGEDALVAAGCLGGAIALLLLLAGLLGFTSMAWLGLVGFGYTLVALILAHLVVRPGRRYREELAYRSGKGPRSRYVAEAEAILRQHGADWVLLFSVASLPHGGFRSLRLTLSEGPPASARANLRVLGSGLPVFKRADRDVPEDIRQELLTLLGELDLAALTDVPARVIDGAPCHLTVLRREPRLMVSAGCNLACLHFGSSGRDPTQHPTVSASSRLNDIVHRLSADLEN